jgi:hypothetical protein
MRHGALSGIWGLPFPVVTVSWRSELFRIAEGRSLQVGFSVVIRLCDFKCRSTAPPSLHAAQWDAGLAQGTHRCNSGWRGRAKAFGQAYADGTEPGLQGSKGATCSRLKQARRPSGCLLRSWPSVVRGGSTWTKGVLIGFNTTTAASQHGGGRAWIDGSIGSFGGEATTS